MEKRDDDDSKINKTAIMISITITTAIMIIDTIIIVVKARIV